MPQHSLNLRVGQFELELPFTQARSSALEIFRAAAPRVVILELHLPGMSGSDLCREIRSRSTTVPIRV